MSPRTYNRTLRQAAAVEARRRIVEAAAALHAEHGGRGTSHAMIAKAAGVSIPTVYKHFPTAESIVPACTGLVAGRAPVVLDESLFVGQTRLPGRVRALAEAMFRLHEYFAPWLRWSASDAAAFPAVRAFLGQVRDQHLALVRRALTLPGRRAPSKELVLLAYALLDFSTWRALTQLGKTSDQAAAVVADAVLHLCRSHRT